MHKGNVNISSGKDAVKKADIVVYGKIFTSPSKCSLKRRADLSRERNSYRKPAVTYFEGKKVFSMQ